MIRKILCLFFGHKWIKTVVTHADYYKHPPPDKWWVYFDPGLARGEWHERTCTRCHSHVESWHREIKETKKRRKYDFKPTEHFAYPNDW